MGKVEIHKIIEEPCDLYGPGDEYIGQIEDVVSFNDVRVQIKENLFSGYYLMFRGEKIKIGINGMLENYPDGLFEKETELLCKLI